jgi:hypothetical protein
MSPQVLLKRISETYLFCSDKYQFDLLSMMPYVLVNSGEYIPDYSSYACYNPTLLLMLLGLTMANYNEKIFSARQDPFRPAFTDVSAASSTLL